MRLERSLLVIVCAIFVAFSTACGPISSITIGRHPTTAPRAGSAGHGGPPPHAPAHGYRHKQRHAGGEVDLVFDSGLGVYVVVGVPDHYYWNGYYLRLDGDRWYASARLDGDWAPRDASGLPEGLEQKRSKASGKAKGRKAHGRKGKKSAPAKGLW